MKKLLIFALVSASLTSLFAEEFSIKKFQGLKYQQQLEHAYNADVSAESTRYHMCFYFDYLKTLNSGKDLTVDEINKNAKKFEGKFVFVGNYYKAALACIFAKNGHEKQMLNLINQKGVDKINALYYCFKYFKTNRNYEKMWEYGKKFLLIQGGCENVHLSQTVLNEMFRYKPESITKQQQIELITKLSQIYPIPGTDFNKWKGFMGFLGYKYKALTGKELF